MELVRHVEPVLRATSSPILSFLAPSLIFHSPSRYIRQYHFRPSSTISWNHKRREFSVAALGRSQAAAVARPEESDDQRDPLNGLLDQRQAPRSQGAKAPLVPMNVEEAQMEAKLKEIFSAEEEPGRKKRSPRSRLEAFPEGRRPNRSGLRQGEIAGGMLMPQMKENSMDTGRNLSQNVFLGPATGMRRNKRTIRSRPTVGRTVEVETKRGVDLGLALKRLAGLVTRNNIRGDQYRQRFHERPGSRRKREKSERWRKYFKEGFKAAVTRVKVMKKQGW